ncbi:hypothetical protein CRE_18650 [Caenorhabditis remanei]|uniref:Uncharacterized protein n=1 Tax=Caenorhabditis remanei TaxID=31234 RepID=E3LKL3_CAERE|nr:hypothetical protein CRE_18650 [Caenorhabditis remanei]
MAGSTTKNTVNIYYRIIRDRMIRFGEDFEVAAHRVNFNILF